MKTEGLYKYYQGTAVLENLTLDFPEGGCCALVGASGAGKTTLLHILMGLLPADAGSVSGFAGRRMSAAFQEDRLCGFLTAAENIRILRTEKGGSRQERMARLRDNLRELLPEEALDKPVSAYSGGMKRRASVARAMLAESEIVFLDEPFLGLDPASRDQTAAFIRSRRGNRTLIFTAHDEAEARFLEADTVIRL